MYFAVDLERGSDDEMNWPGVSDSGALRPAASPVGRLAVGFTTVTRIQYRDRINRMNKMTGGPLIHSVNSVHPVQKLPLPIRAIRVIRVIRG